jgi:hypothetical protein
MTKDELKEKIKTLVKQVYKPETLSMDTSAEISLDAPKFPVLQKFPELKDIIIDLLTDQYEIFISDIQWVAPRPTTFRIVLGNGEPFMLTYTPRSWIAQVEGKKYYLLNLSEEESATEAIARVLAYGVTEEKTEAGDEGDAAETPAEEPAVEEPTAEA